MSPSGTVAAQLAQRGEELADVLLALQLRGQPRIVDQVVAAGGAHEPLEAAVLRRVAGGDHPVTVGDGEHRVLGGPEARIQLRVDRAVPQQVLRPGR